MDPRALASDYMRFAKFEGPARYSLATSGVADADLADLAAVLGDLDLHGPNADGYRPLIERVADRFGVDPSSVVMPGGGCSFANHLAMAALVAPGDEAILETPTYELMASTLAFHQARIHRVERRPDEDWRLAPARFAAAMTPATRLVAVTNLHNPSSAEADDAAIHALCAAAGSAGAVVLVDEVYREMTFGPGEARTAFRPELPIVVTSSLTKAYGLSGLRCGWILAPPALAERMRRLNDLFGVHPPHVAERLAVVAFDRLEAMRARAQAIVEENRAAYREILGGCPRLDQKIFPSGATVFPRLLQGDVDALFAQLKSEAETTFAPGRFFGAPDRLRIGLGGRPQPTRIGLERLASALA